MDVMSNILIVEDDIALNNGIVLSLKQDSLVFLQAFTIEQAKQFLISNEVHLIILDIMQQVQSCDSAHQRQVSCHGRKINHNGYNDLGSARDSS
jgi:DNA-binding response OmpR family regulator